MIILVMMVRNDSRIVGSVLSARLDDCDLYTNSKPVLSNFGPQILCRT